MLNRSLLLAATLVLCGGIAVPMLFPRWPVWARALGRVTALVLLTLLVHRIFGSPFHPEVSAGGGWDRTWQQAIEVGWWVAAARGVAGIARLALTLQSRSRETQILSDLVGAVIYVATAFAVADVVFAVPVGGVLATSGVIAVVIGLALQNTLADVFSGIAIDIERPYRAGDMLTVEGGIEGRVREVNWRSTLITTGSGDVAVVPNSVMAKARLVNHSLPVPVRRTSVEVRLDSRIPPHRCCMVLEAAVRACDLPLADPAPSVLQTALRGDGATYEIAFSVAGTEHLGAAKAEVLGHVQHQLLRAAIPLAADGSAETTRLAPPTTADLLAWSDLFGTMPAPERELVATAMRSRRYAAGEVLFAQSDPADALYVLVSGTLDILRRQPDGKELTRRMGPGDSLGAIGLITDQPYAATATALTAVEVLKLDKTAIGASIKSMPDLVPALEDLAQRGQAEISADIAAGLDHSGERSDVFLSRMRAFLHRLAVDIA